MYPPINEYFADAAHWVYWPDGSITGPGVPPQRWTIAIATVRRDVPFMQTGERANAWDVATSVWNLFISDDDHVAIEIRDTGGRALIYTENPDDVAGRSEASTIDWVADLVQGDFAAHEWVLWPALEGRPPMDPTVVDGRAMWVDHRTREPVVPIGELEAYALGSGMVGEP